MNEERFAKLNRVLVFFATAVYVGLPVVVGLVASRMSDFGSSVSTDLYTVLAEGLLPVLLITSLLQYVLFWRRQMEMESSSLLETRITTNLFALFALFVVAEGLALYAIGAEFSSTFLLVTPLAAGLVFLGDLLFATRHQFGKGNEKYLPSKQFGRVAEIKKLALLNRADRLERQAEELRLAVKGDAADSA
jgi:hypothetical protein